MIETFDPVKVQNNWNLFKERLMKKLFELDKKNDYQIVKLIKGFDSLTRWYIDIEVKTKEKEYRVDRDWFDNMPEFMERTERIVKEEAEKLGFKYHGHIKDDKRYLFVVQFDV